MARTSNIENTLGFEPWESMLSRLTVNKSKPTKKSGQATKSDGVVKLDGQVSLSELSSEAKILGLDCVQRIEFQYSERMNWTKLSGRDIQQAKNELLNKKLVHEVFLGKSLFIAPTEELFLLFGMESPYRRNAWELHSFLVLLASKLIEPDPLIQQVKTEVSIGDANSTIDMVSTTKNGERWAWEITHLCTTNILANCAKLQGKGFGQIIFLCKNHETRQKVWPKIRNAGFDPDFFSTIRCVIFNTLIAKRKKFILRGT